MLLLAFLLFVSVLARKEAAPHGFLVDQVLAQSQVKCLLIHQTTHLLTSLAADGKINKVQIESLDTYKQDGLLPIGMVSLQSPSEVAQTLEEQVNQVVDSLQSTKSRPWIYLDVTSNLFSRLELPLRTLKGIQTLFKDSDFSMGIRMTHDTYKETFPGTNLAELTMPLIFDCSKGEDWVPFGQYEYPNITILSRGVYTCNGERTTWYALKIKQE